MNKTRSGFTIVELLIVIVVIGILAAITIVAYNGVQTRAKNISLSSEATQAAKLLKAFYAIKGQYPTITNGQDAVCIGTGFKDYNSDGIGDCWDADINGVRRGVDISFNNEITSIIGPPSSNEKKPVYNSNDNVNFVGPVYALANGSSLPLSYPSVRFWQLGTSCSAGEKIWTSNNNSATQCGISLAP